MRGGCGLVGRPARSTELLTAHDASAAHHRGGPVDGVDDDLLTGLDALADGASRPRLAGELDATAGGGDAVEGDGRPADLRGRSHEVLLADGEALLEPRAHDHEQGDR